MNPTEPNKREIKSNTYYWADVDNRRVVILTYDNPKYFLLANNRGYHHIELAKIISEVVTPEYWQETLNQKNRDNENINRSRIEHVEANDRANKIIGQQADELMAITQNPDTKIELQSLKESRKFWEDCCRSICHDKDRQIHKLQNDTNTGT